MPLFDQWLNDSRTNEAWEGIVHFKNNEISGGNGRYEGPFQGLLPSGFGVCVYDDGASYSGDWIAGKFDGEGNLKRGYVAVMRLLQFLGSMQCFTQLLTTAVATCACVHRDGSHYNGQWSRGLRHGKGVEVDPNTNER